MKQQFFQFQSADTNSDIRRKIVNILTVSIASSGLATLILVILFDVTEFSYTWSNQEKIGLYAGAALLTVIMPILFLINQRVSTLASWLFLLCLLAMTIVTDSLDRVTERGLIIFAIPIIIASAILRSWSSFIIAGLSGLVIAIIQVLFLKEPVPNFITVIVLFIVALIAHLIGRSKDHAMDKVREANVQLGDKVKTQQNLLQMVNDFALLKSNQQNAVVLFGAHKDVLFANKEATDIVENMDDNSRSQYQAVVERAWEKNLYIHTQFSDIELEITSSLIKIDGGTCLLLQAVRMPDEESKRSLEDWQQKLIAANNLPDDTEFDARAGNMRVKTRDNGKVSKKILFELTAGTLVIEHPTNRRKIQFDLEDLIALCRSE